MEIKFKKISFLNNIFCIPINFDLFKVLINKFYFNFFIDCRLYANNVFYFLFFLVLF